jgi:hypothetical protein
MTTDCAFYLLDSVGSKFCYTVASADYAPKFRNHARWWRNYARSAEYRAKVDPMRYPAFPVTVVIEPIEHSAHS